MIRITKYKNKILCVTYSIMENPTRGSYGDYLLLKNELLKLDDRWENVESQSIFNMNYLKNMRENYNILHCAYCNKKPLRIYEFHEKGKDDMATTDHILPRSSYPELSKELTNLTVACRKCNGKKSSKIQEIKYSYE